MLLPRYRHREFVILVFLTAFCSRTFINSTYELIHSFHLRCAAGLEIPVLLALDAAQQNFAVRKAVQMTSQSGAK
jgi:hypothetical protein